MHPSRNDRRRQPTIVGPRITPQSTDNVGDGNELVRAFNEID